MKFNFRRHFLLCVFGSLISTRSPVIMLMRIMKIMWGKYCRIYPEFAKKNNSALSKVPYNQYTTIDCLIAQDNMKNRFYKIKFTAASDQVLNCQPKIVILNNIYMSLSYYYRGKLILCSKIFISSIPIFRTSKQNFRTSRFLVLTGSVPVNFCEIF